MNASAQQVRRATVDDVRQLVALWQMERLPWETLEKRFTEFQVVADPEGRILGGIGLQIAAHQGLLHSEAFLQADQADTLRERLWQRIQSLTHNHGIVRLWTLEATPYWHHNGFQPGAAEIRQKLPPAFGDRNAAWHVLEMRAEAPPIMKLPDKEFAVFKEAEQARTAEIFRRARVMKIIATVLAALLFLGVVIALVYLVKKLPPAR
jgi:N-acetylglutamate synthase-like GNAT family acetyltransferase